MRRGGEKEWDPQRYQVGSEELFTRLGRRKEGGEKEKREVDPHEQRTKNMLICRFDNLSFRCDTKDLQGWQTQFEFRFFFFSLLLFGRRMTRERKGKENSHTSALFSGMAAQSRTPKGANGTQDRDIER